MDIICNQCQSRFRISDKKIPRGKVATILCPKCKNKISVSLKQEPVENKQKTKQLEISLDEIDSDTYDDSDKFFDFAEEEGNTALVCEPDPAIKKSIKAALKILEYNITETENARDALTKMRYQNYDMIIVNEYFDTNDPDLNGVLIFLERLNMSTRRNIFLVLLSKKFRTMDNMLTLHKSVNLIININDINEIGKILSRGLTNNDIFYRVFKESKKEAGGL